MTGAAHRSTTWRRQRADEWFPAEDRAWVLQCVADGWTVAETMADLGLPVETAYGRTRWDVEWRDALFHAQITGRDPALPHGHWAAYQQGCDCPECRSLVVRNTAARRWCDEHLQT